MSISIPKIKFPELFFGFVAPIGADLTDTLAAFRAYFTAQNYKVIELKVTDIFQFFKNYCPPTDELKPTPLNERYETHIQYGNQLRETLGDDVLASSIIYRISNRRVRRNKTIDDTFSRTAYLLSHFKRKEEIDLLRSIYGQLFFQVSVYSRRGARIDYLSRGFANSQNSAAAQSFRAHAEAICQRDEDEVDKPHGQRVAKIFHDADFIVSLDSAQPTVKEQVYKFCDLIFSSNAISPTRMEYGLFLAKAAALRSLDLSRQVGAAIFSETGEIIALGANEVPKARGGNYWPDSGDDDRDYRRGYDSNDQRKRQILGELISSLKCSKSVDEALSQGNIRDSQFMDALEYGRVVHAEMSAICDAARMGRSTRGATLYCTTFPCHMCAKHVVASGLDHVVFLEPYPKSLASELHNDSILIEGADRGKYQDFPSVQFQHFFGITPLRYRELFERDNRKDSCNQFIKFGMGEAVPIIDIKVPFYTQLEAMVLKQASEILEKVSAEEEAADQANGK